MVLAGQILGRAGVYDGKNVVQTQSYGAEARGSAAKSEVIISNERIGYPLVRKCNVLIALTQETLDANINDLEKNAVVIVEKDLVKQVPEIKGKVYRLPIASAAKAEFKSGMYANVVMLGILTEKTKIISREAMRKAIKASVKPDMVEANLNAFERGLKL